MERGGVRAGRHLGPQRHVPVRRLAFDRLDLARKLVDQRSKDQVALLLQHSSDVIVLLDPAGTVLFASPAAGDLAAPRSPWRSSGRAGSPSRNMP